ncbi:uracil phosphoribosyltransferase-domain-containing protein [Biscogniauxia mediterranea]|nr:uracil phosphoribosyltransferase-domain-containing protein [Biscogniauxia mediterranea]
MASPDGKPTVVGLYSIPGSGKTHLLQQLQKGPLAEQFRFYEGSEVIASLVTGGLDAFRRLDDQEKTRFRQLAICRIQQDCRDSGCAAVVTGHFMFWSEGQDVGQPVYTQKDLETYTHIIYLDIPAPDVWKQRHNDTNRSRPSLSIEHLEKWQTEEKDQIRRLCYENKILFSVVSPPFIGRVPTLLRDFCNHTKQRNTDLAKCRLDDLLSNHISSLETILVIDGDKTLSAEDTGSLFWSVCCKNGAPQESPLKRLFSSPMKYSHTAFRQASLLYDDLNSKEGNYERVCKIVASRVTIHPEFLSLLRRIETHQHVAAVVLTCGIGRVWKKVLHKTGLSNSIVVMGNGLVSDGIVVTPETKAALVTYLRDTHNLYVWAFGDSPLDIPMLEEANQPVIVVGEEMNRSRTMDAALLKAFDRGTLRLARQVLLPSTAAPRLDTINLPVTQLGCRDLIDSLISHHNHSPNPSLDGLHIMHATDKKAAKLLMTPTRDAGCAGFNLVKEHQRVGWFLAMEYIAELVGVEDYPINHVQGHQTSGHRFCDEQKTLIVALMRGGEPMAYGVFKALKQATFLHAKHAEDITSHYLQQRTTVVLVDSVINSGDTMVRFVEHVRNLHKSVRIIVVALVVQKDAISEGSYAKKLSGYKHLSLVALRISNNKFKGRGTTDTGNRLFNTTEFD